VGGGNGEAAGGPEQEPWTMMMEHPVRTFQGAFHMNPDYMHWYGWAELKKTSADINDEATRLREEKK